MSGHNPFGGTEAEPSVPEGAVPGENGPHGYSSGESASLGGGVFSGNEDTHPGVGTWDEFLTGIGFPNGY